MKQAVLLVGLAAILGGGCSREQFVAEVDGKPITVREFAARYEQFLSQGSMRDNIKLRHEVLDNMINERLIFNDVVAQGLDRDSVYRRRMEVAMRQALLDAYARRISFDTIRISEQEAREEFRLFNTRATARYLYAKTKKGAWELKRRLQNGETFESLAREVFEDPGLATNGGYLGEFGWGEMEAALEEAAFTLPVGTISDPIKLRIGYAIVKPESRIVQPLASEYDYAKVRQKLADRIQEKKIDHLIRKATDEIVQSLAPTFNDEAVRTVFAHWTLLARNEVPPSEPRSLPKDISAMTFMHTSRGSWTVRDFVERAEWTTDKQRRRVHSEDDVKDYAIGLATREVLLERARAEGLEKDSAVQAQLASVRERFLLRRWADSVQDTVGSSGWDARLLDSVYQANKAHLAYPPEVNVAEILVRTEEEARQIRAQLSAGADFGELARRRSIRLWAAKRGGELGFGTQAAFGPMGEKFFAASVGEILGPERVDPYWAVFKVLERRQGRPKSFDEARSDIVAVLTQERRRQAFRAAVGDLRSRASITVNSDLLANIVIHTESQARGRSL